MTIKEKFRNISKFEKKNLKCVLPFSLEANRPNSTVYPPPKCNIYRERKILTSKFRKYYLRGDIPIHRAGKKTESGMVLEWMVPPEELDYAYYLPIFFEGLCESKDPYKLFARNGVKDMLNVGGNKIFPVVPQLIFPIKKAFNTRNKDVIVATLKAIQQLLEIDPCIGKILVPYYRQILPILNIFFNKNINIGDRIDFNSKGLVGEIIEETLNLLEIHGGQDAYINIKYMIPTYESSVYK